MVGAKRRVMMRLVSVSGALQLMFERMRVGEGDASRIQVMERWWWALTMKRMQRGGHTLLIACRVVCRW